MTNINKYQAVEDLIVSSVRRGVRSGTDLKVHGVIWAAMAEVAEREDNPYIWNAIRTRLQALRDRGILAHDRSKGWTLAEQQKETQ